MTEIVEENGPRDHYRAELEDGSLAMKPYCSCGNLLDEGYFCEKCNRKCRCHQIVCDNEATLETVKSFMKKSPQFSGFKVRLAEGN